VPLNLRLGMVAFCAKCGGRLLWFSAEAGRLYAECVNGCVYDEPIRPDMPLPFRLESGVISAGKP
jgi:hypothetical protein